MVDKEAYAILYKDISKISKKYPPLGKDRERELYLQYITTKDKKCKDILYYSNLRVIIKEVKSYHYAHGINPSIFMELCSLGLTEGYECIDRFSLDEGNASICSWIKNSVYRAISNFAKENIDFHGEFVSIRKPANRYNESILNEKAYNMFSHNNFYPPLRGETITILNKNKEILIEFDKKEEILVISGNNETCEGFEFFDGLEISDAPSESLIDMTPLISSFDQRGSEIYELLYVQGKTKNSAVLHMTPQSETETIRAEKSGSNKIEINKNGYLYKLNIISYIKNGKQNDKKYSDGHIEFDYYAINDGVYEIHTNKEYHEFLDTKLKMGYPITSMGLTDIERGWINSIRQNKNITNLINEYYQ